MEILRRVLLVAGVLTGVWLYLAQDSPLRVEAGGARLHALWPVALIWTDYARTVTCSHVLR